MRRVVAAAVLTTAVAFDAGPARATETTQITLRDNVYTFESPGNPVGPWYSLKLDVVHDFPKDVLTLRAANGFHDNAQPAHGEFLRLEDYHRFSPAVLVKVAAGAGSGYQPIRSTVAEISIGIPKTRGVAAAIGEVLTSNHNGSFQRIVALGPDVTLGSLSANLRYYHAEITTNVVAPPSYEFLASERVSNRIALGLIADLGGEVGGDRTASQLPTSSGLYGPALGLSATYGVGQFHVVGGYQEGEYRASKTGALAYRQFVTTFGLATALGR